MLFTRDFVVYRGARHSGSRAAAHLTSISKIFPDLRYVLQLVSMLYILRKCSSVTVPRACTRPLMRHCNFTLSHHRLTAGNPSRIIGMQFVLPYYEGILECRLSKSGHGKEMGGSIGIVRGLYRLGRGESVIKDSVPLGV
jgi:hypothetical protein